MVLPEGELARYRPEIDGLRAIAILAVLGFHLGFSDWSGGFLGVDIFFVLSGYLICGQIYLALQQGDFSALDFVARRIRRLSTAAFACFLAVGVAAWSLFVPFELPQVARNLLGSITFTNNLLLMQEAGYFAPAAEANPLIHTWSLAIEEQFYILLPLLILALRRSASGFVWALAVLALLSLGLVLFSGEMLHSRDARYFSTEFRIWQLALGGLVAVLLCHVRIPRLPLVPLVGLAAAVTPVFLVTGTPVHPGPWALLVCFGTALLLISANPARSWTGRVLAMRVPRYLGRISYGTYLWHWPLIVFFQYVGGDLNDRGRVLFLLASFAMGALSHHLIEAPMRRLPIQRHRNRLFLIFALQTLILAALAGALVWKARNADPAEAAAITRIMDAGVIANPDWDDCWYRDNAPGTCGFGLSDPSARSADSRPMILWGDSMANSARPAFDSYAAQAGTGGRLFTAPGCAPLLGMARDQSSVEGCLALNRHVLAELEAAPPTDVFLFARWPYYAGGYANPLDAPAGTHPFVDADLNRLPGDTFDNFAKGLADLLAAIPDRHRVTLIGPAPEMPHHVPLEMVKALRFGGTLVPLTRAVFDRRTGRTLAILAEVTARQGTAFVDLTPDFCDAEVCRQSQDGLPLIADQVHLTALGNDLLLDRLRSSLPLPPAP